MIKIAHMSSREKAQLLIKKARKGKYKLLDAKRAKLAAMTEEERKAYDKKILIGEIENKLSVYEWDYKHKQLPPHKKKMFKDLIVKYFEIAENPDKRWEVYQDE